MKGMGIGPSLLIAILLSGCEALSEHPLSRRPFPSYSELKQPPKPPPISPSELAQCPRPNGVFQNESAIGAIPGLEGLFLVPGFQVDAARLGGGPDDAPIRTRASAINLLGGMEAGIRKHFTPSPNERFTIELRPIDLKDFHIVVRSNLGRSAEGKGTIRMGRTADGSSGERCENGALRSYSPAGLYQAWWVDEATGDVVMAYRADLDRGTVTYRYKRIGK